MKQAVLYLERNSRIILGLILFASLAVKIGLLIYFNYQDPALLLTLDAGDYIRLAKTIIETGTFSISPDFAGVPETIRTPGYPLFVALVYTIFGYHNSAVIILQIVLSLLTITIVFKIAEELAGRSIAVIASALIALDILTLDFTLRMMAETLFTLFVVLIFLAGIRLIKTEGKAKYALILGILTAAATQIRPINYFLFVFLLIFFLIFGMVKRWKAGKLVWELTLILIPTIILVGGWQLRNYRLTGYSDFSAIANINMYFFRAAEIIASQEGKTLKETQREMGYHLYQETLWSNKPEMAKTLDEWKTAGLKIVKQHPWLLMKMLFKSTAWVIVRPGGGAITHFLGYDLNMLQKEQSNTEIVAFLGIKFKIFTGFAFTYLLLLYSGVIAWLLSIIKARSIEGIHLFLIVLVFYFILLSGGTEGVSRIRIPMMPLLAIISGLGWSFLIGHFARKREDKKDRRMEG